MSSDLTGAVFNYVNFLPKTGFLDVDTVGYENVKNEKDIKLLHLSAPSSSLLSEKIKSFSKYPPTSSKMTYDADDSNKFRHAVLYSSINNLTNALSTSPTSFNTLDVPSPKLCFIITCQGTQYSGMGKEVYEWSPTFRHHFDECDAITMQDYGISVKKLMDSKDGAWISNPMQALPYILSVEYSLFKLWEFWGIRPDVVLGLSFGDYGAALVSGIVSLRDTIKLVMTRTQLITNNIKEEAFAAIQMDVSEIPKIMEILKKEDGMEDAWLDVAGIISPLQTCVVGYRKYVLMFVNICKRNGTRCMLMDPYHPYHSRLTAPVIPQFEETTSKIKYNRVSNGKFISTVRKGRVMETLDKDYYLEHLQGPSLFTDAMVTVLKDEGITHFLEIGPHPINIQMVKDILENKFPEMGTNFNFYRSITRNESDRLTLFNTLGRLYTAGFNINWENVNVTNN